jgi:hypothetical protein
VTLYSTDSVGLAIRKILCERVGDTIEPRKLQKIIGRLEGMWKSRATMYARRFHSSICTSIRRLFSVCDARIMLPDAINLARDPQNCKHAGISILFRMGHGK